MLYLCDNVLEDIFVSYELLRRQTSLLLVIHGDDGIPNRKIDRHKKDNDGKRVNDYTL